MKNLKYKFGVLMSFLAIAALSSCTEEVEYTPAEPAAVETSEYYFTQDTETGLVIGQSDKVIVAEVNRVNTEGEETLDLIVTNPTSEYFTIPSSVTFADGEATAQIVVEVSDSLPLFENFQFSIQIPEKFVNPYIAENNNPTLHYVVQRDDYLPYAAGVYYSYWWEQEYEMVLEYSEVLGLFRFKNFCLMDGYHVTFKFNPETNEIVMTSAAYPSGYVHSAYGMVTAEVYNKGTLNSFDPETMLFKFAYKWTVAAGSFGAGYDYFSVTEIYE